MIFRFSGRTVYFGKKLRSSTFTPISRFGMSRTWPIDALATTFLPRNRSIVRAFAGDSTITKSFAI